MLLSKKWWRRTMLFKIIVLGLSSPILLSLHCTLWPLITYIIWRNIWMFPKIWFIEVLRCKYLHKLQSAFLSSVPVALLRDVLTRKMKRRKQIRRRKEGRCMHPDFWEIVCFLPREINSEGAKKLPFQPLKMGFVINNGWKINHF